MAVDICREVSSPVISPRISFSHDLQEADFESKLVRSDSLLLNSTIDFDFRLSQSSFSQQLPSADELFANGKILPVEIKKISPSLNQPLQSDPASDHPRKSTTNAPHKMIGKAKENTEKKRLIEFLSSSSEEKPLVKTFWQFRRSNSYNCGNGRSSTNGLLKFLTRSNSTGSAPNPKSTKVLMQKQNSLKETSACSRPSSFNLYCPPCNSNASRGGYLKKSTSSSHRSYGNGVSFNPVLNIPPSYIAKGTVSLFGIGSLFCSKKSKKKKN